MRGLATLAVAVVAILLGYWVGRMAGPSALEVQTQLDQQRAAYTRVMDTDGCWWRLYTRAQDGRLVRRLQIGADGQPDCPAAGARP